MAATQQPSIITDFRQLKFLHLWVGRKWDKQVSVLHPHPLQKTYNQWFQPMALGAGKNGLFLDSRWELLLCNSCSRAHGEMRPKARLIPLWVRGKVTLASDLTFCLHFLWPHLSWQSLSINHLHKKKPSLAPDPRESKMKVNPVLIVFVFCVTCSFLPLHMQ